MKKERGKLKARRRKTILKTKNPKHIQMITTDATVSKMEKMKKSDEKTTEKSQKNCKTNLKIKTKNRSTPSKLRKVLESHNQSEEEKENTNTIVSGAREEEKEETKSSQLPPQISAREIEFSL